MPELLERRPSLAQNERALAQNERALAENARALAQNERASVAANDVAHARTSAFLAVSFGVHLVLSLVMPSEVPAHAIGPAAPEQSFFELVPLPPPPAQVAAPEPPPPPVEPVERVAPTPRVRAIPTSEPPAATPEATPEASTVVADTEGVVQQATVGTSVEGGLAVAVTAGSGSGGAIAGTRHEGPVGQAVSREERRADLEALLRAYRALVSSELRPHLRQPRMIGREAETRTVKLGITIDAAGRVLSVRLRESCGTEHLDALALDSVRAVAHVSAPPAELPWQRPRELTFPVVYR